MIGRRIEIPLALVCDHPSPTSILILFWLVVSTPLKNISEIGSFPQVGVKIKIFETTIQFFEHPKPTGSFL